MRRRFLPIICILLFVSSQDQGFSADEEPAELSQMRAVFQKEVDFATRPIRDRYLSKLEGLKRSLGSRGDARAAVDVQDEIDRVKGSSSNATTGTGIAQFAGSWRIHYTNGSSRRYILSADGTARFIEDNRQPVSHSGTIVLQGEDFLLDFGDGVSIERVSMKGGNLFLEHWNPKSAYPAVAPIARGTGTLSTAAK